MENETIEEAVAFIETATGNIKEALKHDTPRDGIELGELIQLLDSGDTPINIAIPMNGRYWETKITISEKFLNGSWVKSTESFRYPSVILSRKIKRIHTDGGGFLWVYLGDK